MEKELSKNKKNIKVKPRKQVGWFCVDDETAIRVWEADKRARGFYWGCE